MYFSPSTIAALAGLIATASAAPSVGENHNVELGERGLLSSILGGGFSVSTPQTPLCNKPNYGAIGKPWEKNSVPAAFCGNKPKNTGDWKNLPTWDGGDKVKCNSWLASWGIKVCSTGNPTKPLPWGCKPPKKGGNQPKPTPPAPTSKTSTTSVAPSSTTTAATSPVTSPAAGTTDPATSTTSSTAAADPSPSAGSDDPYSNPVCSGKYQQTFDNYTLIAPNGYWYGKRVGAAIQDDSYMTFTLATDPAACLAACDNIEGCAFVNVYTDRNDDESYLSKHTPGTLTCAMFAKCVGTEKADNWGGQDDPNDIVDSEGWCKSGACGQ